MDYSKINNYLENLQVSESGSGPTQVPENKIPSRDINFEEKRQNIFNRDIDFLKNTNNFIENRDYSVNVNIQKKDNKNIKNDINDRLNSREHLPKSSGLNIYGRDIPIMDHFPKTSNIPN